MFDQYLTTIGQIELQLSTDSSQHVDLDEIFVVDLKQLPVGGLPLWSAETITAGRWDLSYSLSGAGDGATRHESVTEADYDEMVSQDWTYLIRGELSRADGQSCPPASIAIPGDREPNGALSGENPCYDAPTLFLL